MASITYPVKFHGEALAEWRKAFPELPPGDEIVLMMRVDPCSVCGADPLEGEFAGLDPEEIVDGVLIGQHICMKCIEEEEAEDGEA